MKSKVLHTIVWKENKIFVAKFLEIELASQGKTKEEAVKNLKEACELYIEEMGIPEGISSEHIIVTSFGIEENEITSVVGT